MKTLPATNAPGKSARSVGSPMATPLPLMPYSPCRRTLSRNTKPVCGGPSTVMTLPVGNAVLWSMTTPWVPLSSVKSRPSPPHVRPSMSSNRLSRITTRRVCWLGGPSSRPLILIPEALPRTTLSTNVTSSTTVHGARPSWLRGENSTAVPDWAWPQACSNTLPATRTRRAFFSSKRFLTVHGSLRHASGLVKWLPRISMSLGTRLAIAGSAPPNIMLMPAASR